MNPSVPAAEATVYRVEGPQTIAGIEQELAGIEALRPERLLVPVRPKKWWFGGESALIQLLITWGRRQENATLVTHIAKGEEPAGQLEQLVKRPFGLVGVWMARDVTDRRCARALKVLANQASEPVIDMMWRGRRDPRSAGQRSLWGEGDDDAWEAPHVSAVGDRVFLASIDHHPRWRIPQCYFPTGEVRYRDDFVALADAMSKYAAVNTGGSPVTADVRKPLGTILHELFKNTHEWARTNAYGAALPRSVRGLLAQGHSWAEGEVREVAQGSEALAEYLGYRPFHSEEGRWRFLELSIFDSGIGLARRWLSGNAGREIDLGQVSLDDEYRACTDCFLRWNSSTGQGHKGLGLHEVMQTLSGLRAFFRVRTGRLSLYRNFVERPYPEPAPAGARLFADWSAHWGALTACALAEGTLYTMLIPITPRRS
jgi:hypothetical protein